MTPLVTKHMSQIIKEMKFFYWFTIATVAVLSGIQVSGLEAHNASSRFLPKFNDYCQADLFSEETFGLSEMPMDRLLRASISITHLRDDAVTSKNEADEDAVLEQNDSPEVLPPPAALKSRHRHYHRPLPITPRNPVPRGDTYSGGHHGGKQSRLASGFQLAITVLSFLAFGAYLIGLVVSIVRNNNGTAATTQTPLVFLPAGRKKRSAYKSWDPPHLPSPDNIFQIMTTVARAFAKFEGHVLPVD